MNGPPIYTYRHPPRYQSISVVSPFSFSVPQKRGLPKTGDVPQPQVSSVSGVTHNLCSLAHSQTPSHLQLILRLTRYILPQGLVEQHDLQ